MARLLLSVALLAVASLGAPVELDARSFEPQISAGGFWAVKFFAPWCGHCKRLAPIWDALAEKYAGDSRVHVAKVDCTQHHDLCTRNGVRGFPTLIGFVGPNAREGHAYQGARTLEAFSEWLETNAAAVPDPTVPPEPEPVAAAEPAASASVPAADAVVPAPPAGQGRGLGGNVTSTATEVGVDGAAAAAAALAVAEDRARAAVAEVARLRRELQREKEEHAACLATIRRVEDALVSGHGGLAAHGAHR